MSYTYRPRRTTAPMAVQIIAAIQYLTGTLTVAFGVMLALAAIGLVPRIEYVAGDSTWTNRPADVTPVVAVICATFAVVGLAAIVLGRKVQRGRNWARIVLIVLSGLSLAAVAVRWYSVGHSLSVILATGAIPALFLILLNTRDARSWCRRAY